MPQVVEGELVKHHDQPFYAQSQRPRYFWGGCLIPIAVVLLFGILVVKGATTSAGSEVIRGFLIAVIFWAIAQLLIGGGLFWRKRSSLAQGLLIGGAAMLLLIFLALIAIASIVGSFLK